MPIYPKLFENTINDVVYILYGYCIMLNVEKICENNNRNSILYII